MQLRYLLQKIVSRHFFLWLQLFREIWHTLKVFKNLIANKIIINRVNDDQKDFVFNLIIQYNLNNFFNKNEIIDIGEKSLYEKGRSKAIEILLKFEKKCRKDQKVSSKNILKKNTSLRIKKVFC